MFVGHAVVNISGEKVKVTVTVNEKGNLEISGIDSVTYQMYDEELVLTRYNEENEENN